MRCISTFTARVGARKISTGQHLPRESKQTVSRESNIPIIHETHRNKWSYAAHVVKDYLSTFPRLELALDLSHWVCVSESYLDDQQEAVDIAIRNTKPIRSEARRAGNECVSTCRNRW